LCVQSLHGPCHHLCACRAHNTLFIAELASQQYRLPPHLQSKAKGSKKSKGAKAKDLQEELSSAAGDSDPDYEENVGRVLNDVKDTSASGKGRAVRAKRIRV